MPVDRSRAEGADEGWRPSGVALMGGVDQDDPALMAIVAVLHEMRGAGIDPDEHVVRVAVALGRHRHDRATRQCEARTGASDESNETSIVYYVRRADLIKIGTTTQPHSRFAALLPDEILAWEPGGRTVERARHQEFAKWRVGGSEYFRANEPLSALAGQLHELHGQPKPDWPTLASVSAIRSKHLTPLAAPAIPVLVTVGEGVEALGIKRNTADMWVRRKSLIAAGKNQFGRPVYLLAHMRELAERGGLMQPAGAA
ncbi:GIY-YIG nuclease family protein [Streptomyces sp. NPDC059994]|uniref:GIY-YIG nuclease family protein n=1 Tax=Streptomyces sp. NPDC059994 TaxID=3347029 RepID=UPI0036D10EDE